MNSIEFLELELHEFLRQNQKKIDKGTINPLTVQFMIDNFTKAINDLKVLEILKDNAIITKGEGRWKGIEIIEISVGSESTEDYKLVKECLEED